MDLNKRDKEDCISIITELSGKTHLAHTAVIVHMIKEGKVMMIPFEETTEIEFENIPKSSIEEYSNFDHP